MPKVADLKKEDRGDSLGPEDLDDFEDEELDVPKDEDLDEDTEDLDEDIEDLDEDTEDLDEDTEDPDEEEEEELKNDNARIPRSRLNEVIEQRDSQREENAWLKQQLAEVLQSQKDLITRSEGKKTSDEPVVEYDFEEAEVKYADFLLEGETAKAAALRKEMNSELKAQRAAELKALREELTASSANTSKAALEEDRFNTLIDQYESKYPELNADSDEYNEEAIDTINSLMNGFMKDGVSKAAALKKAVERVSPLYGLDHKEPSSKKALGSSSTDKSRRKRKVIASKKQPPKTSQKKGASIDLDNLKISDLSDSQFNKLTEREKKILRGDI